jgi:LysR family hydrogen peroxide-inducible transcriptional activator
MNFAPFPVTLRQLQYLVAVADRKSFRQAAEDCHVSQPSLSEQVALAEESLGVKLFERNRRGVVLTAAGQVLVEEARAICLSVETLHESARRFTDPFSGRLRLGAIPTVAPYLLPLLAPVLRKEYPKLKFLWTEDKTHVLVERLRQGELDGAILALEADIGDLSQVVLGKDPFVLAAKANHPLMQSKRPLRVTDLEGESVLLLDDGHCFRKQVLSFCTKGGAEEVGYRATSLATLVQMSAGGIGITILPTLALAVENRMGSLAIRPFAPKIPARTLALCWRPRSALEATLSPVGLTLRKAYESLSLQGLREVSPIS